VQILYYFRTTNLRFCGTSFFKPPAPQATPSSSSKPQQAGGKSSKNLTASQQAGDSKKAGAQYASLLALLVQKYKY
jgi:hypothetical protein